MRKTMSNSLRPKALHHLSVFPLETKKKQRKRTFYPDSLDLLDLSDTRQLRSMLIMEIYAQLLFIHSFIPAISIAPLQVLCYSEALPTTARILYRSFTPKRTGNCR